MDFLIKAVFLKVTLLYSVQTVSFANALNYETYGSLANIFLDTIQKPLRLTAVVCWNKEESFRFYRSFHREYRVGGGIYYRDYQFSVIAENELEFIPNELKKIDNIIMLDLNCNNSVNLLMNQMDILSVKWLIFKSKKFQTNQQIEADITTKLTNIFASPQSEIYYLFSGNDGITIGQIYRISMTKPIILEKLYTLMDQQFLASNNGSFESMISRRRNLDGLLLRSSMVITNNDSLNHLTDYRDKHIDTVSKVNYILTNHLRDYVNATVKYSIVDTWGYEDKDTGYWTGMIGELVRNETDIGASPAFVTIDRVPIIQYIARPTPTGSRFIFRSPKLSYTDNVFLLPFSKMVWYCLVGLIIVTTFALTVAIFVEWSIPLAEMNPTDPCPSFGDGFLIVFGATCQQGSAFVPYSATARVIMVVIFIVLMFLFTSYSANIVALLQSPSNKIKTLQDLLNSRLKLGVHDTVYNRHFFSHETEPTRKAIYEEKILQKDGSANFIELYDGVKRIQNGLYAFHMEYGVGYKVISETFYEDEKCSLRELKYLEVIDPWYAIQKNSPYRDLFKTGMLRMNEHGLQDRENSRLYTKKPKCNGVGGHFITASLVDTSPAILILVWGIVLGIVTLIFELVFYRLFSSDKYNNMKK